MHIARVFRCLDRAAVADNMVDASNRDGRDYTDHQTRARREIPGVMPKWLALGLVLAIGASAFSGIIYWAINGWLVGVVLSALLPGFGLVSILVSIIQ